MCILRPLLFIPQFQVGYIIMTLLFKQSSETNKETLCVKLEDDQGIMRKIQAGCVSWLVNLLEIRW